MSETFTTFISSASTRTLDGTELIPLITSVPNTEQNTLNNISLFISAPASQNLTNSNDGDTLDTTYGIYYATLSPDGEYNIYLPTSASMTNRTLTFIAIESADEGGLNILPNGDTSDQIQQAGTGEPFTIGGNGGSVQLLSDGQGNWWIASSYAP